MELVHGAGNTRCVGLQKEMIAGNNRAPCIMNCSLADARCAFIQKFLGSQSNPLVAHGLFLGLSRLRRYPPESSCGATFCKYKKLPLKLGFKGIFPTSNLQVLQSSLKTLLHCAVHCFSCTSFG